MNKKWTILSSRHEMDITTTSGIHYSIHKDLKDYSKSNEILFYSYCANRQTTNYIAVDIIDFGKFLFDREMKNLTDVEKIIQYGAKLLKDSELLTDQHKNEKSVSSSFYNQFILLYEQIASIFTLKTFIMIEYWQNESLNNFQNFIRKYDLQESENDIFSYLFHPYKKTALGKLQDELLAGKPLDDLINKYQFMRAFTLIWHKSLDEKWFLDLKARGKNKNNENFAKIREVIGELPLNREEREFIKMASYISYLKDYRDDIRRKFSYIWNFMFRQISDHCGVDYEDLGYLSIYEIKDLLDGEEKILEKIPHRKNNSVVLTKNINNKLVLIDEKIPLFFKDYQNQRISYKQHIKGLSSFPGIVQGEVKIINSYDDIQRFQKGKILVAKSTQPNYLPAMQKAIAFVTDEGGILCHAAIVSRELHRPCIVGTKIATKVLKDGDMVEVDANKGIVRKI